MIAVIVLALAVVGWAWLQERSKDRDSAAAAACVEGTVTLNVTIDPAIAESVKAAGERFNATTPHMRDHCAQVAVTAQPSAAMVTAFAGVTTNTPWDPALGPQPGLWIPDSSRSVELMRIPGLIAGTPLPVAVSPIAVAVPDELRRAMETAQTKWADLPRLQQGSLSDLGLATWGPLRMAMPTGDPTLAVATAVGSGVSGTDPLDETAARSGQVISAVSQLAATAPPTTDLTAALTELAAAADPAAAPLHAVAATEQQIRTHPDLTAFRPVGNGPVNDYPAAEIVGNWVNQTQNLVAGLFVDFLRATEQSKLFTDNGFGAAPPATSAVPAKAVLTQVQQVLANPILGVHATALVDTSASMSTQEGAMTRLANSLAALQSTMTVMPPEFGLGVWTYAKTTDGSNPYRIAAPTAALTDQQRTAITQALGTVTASSIAPDLTYPSLEAAYRSAVENCKAGRTNSILLITDGPQDDSTITGEQLLTDIAGLGNPAKPIRIDVIVVGGNGTQTLQTLSQRTGGTYTKVTSSNDLAFATAVANALTTP